MYIYLCTIHMHLHMYKIIMQVYMYVHICRATGNKMYGTKYEEDIKEIVRRTAEYCDCLQSFLVLHSMGGGETVYLLGGRRVVCTCVCVGAA